jgi:hypothetical protein
MQHANLLETLENVMPEEMLQRIVPILTSSPSLSSLRQSAAARFQSGNVSGSDDEKPEPLSQSPLTSATSPHVKFSMQSSNGGTGKRHSMWAGGSWGGEASPPSASTSSNHSAGKRHSMWAGSGAGSASALPSPDRRLSLSRASAQRQFTEAGGSQSNSPSSVTVSPVAQLQARPPSLARSSTSPGSIELLKQTPARASLSIPAHLQHTAEDSASFQHAQFRSQGSSKLEAMAEDDEVAESLDNVVEAQRAIANVNAGGAKQAQQQNVSLARVPGEPRRQSWAPASTLKDAHAGSAKSLAHAAASKGSKRRSVF